jgi:hypothetical protein
MVAIITEYISALQLDLDFITNDNHIFSFDTNVYFNWQNKDIDLYKIF